jgi:DNA-binding beta-propeller fold protein YncE
VEIDPTTDRVVNRIDLGGADENHGLLIDPEGRRAFIACEGNDRLLVLDLQTKKVAASFQVGKDPDVLAFDPGLHYVYVAGEAGVITIFTLQAGRFRRSLRRSWVRMRMVAVDATTHGLISH